MTPEERDLITQFVQRVGGRPAASGFGGSVPATTGSPALPPVDPAADALIGELCTRYPEARYRITQMAFVQEHALMEAQNRIARLEWELNNARQQAAQTQPAASPWGQAAQPQAQQSSGGFFGGLFGGRSSPPPQQPMQQPMMAPPQPQYAPGYQPGMFQQQSSGSGFLGSALTTAAGVAGGMVAGHALMNLFSGGHGGGGGFGSAASSSGFGGQTASSSWSDPYAQGGPAKADTGWTDAAPVNNGWSAPTSAPGWTEEPAAQDGGWTESEGDSGWVDSDPE